MPCSGELKSISCRSNLFFDCKGSCPLIVKFLGGVIHLQVPGVQPNQVSLGVFTTRTLPCIITLLHCHSRFLHCFFGCSSGFCELSQPLICCWVHFCGWANPSIPWLPSILKEEWRLPSC